MGTVGDPRSVACSHPCPSQRRSSVGYPPSHPTTYTMTLDFMRFAGVPGEKPKYGKGGDKREKRLERNRESARKCRRKRKAYVGDLEEKCQGLAEDNAMLQLENDRLRELLQQLQNGEGILPESLPKRHKSEFGVSMANDFSESAVLANQQSRLEEFSQLAILTTFLLVATLTTATWTMAPYLTTPSDQVAVAPAPAARPMVARCELQSRELWLRQRSCSVT